MKKKTTLLILFMLTIISCNQKTDIIQGDLYFKLIDFGSLYNVDKEKADKFKNSLDSARTLKNISENDLKIFNYYDKLEKNNILESPYIRVRTDSTIIQVFLSEKEFRKVEKFNHSDLIKNKRKVSIKLEIIELEKDIYFSDKIIDYKEIYGQTYWKK